MPANSAITSWDELAGVLFDLDGVVTPTEQLHRRAWTEAFIEYGITDDDYRVHVDGKPRYNGVASFLASRAIDLPWGDPSDHPELQTVCGLGNSKDALFLDLLDDGLLVPYPDAVRLLGHLDQLGVQVGLVSSSRNAVAVLTKTGLYQRFECIVDGLVAVEKSLMGKPAPDTYVYGAGQLGLIPGQCAVIEDALSGVQAGVAGGFGLVIGVARHVGAASGLREAGADLVVGDLDEIFT